MPRKFFLKVKSLEKYIPVEEIGVTHPCLVDSFIEGIKKEYSGTLYRNEIMLWVDSVSAEEKFFGGRDFKYWCMIKPFDISIFLKGSSTTSFEEFVAQVSFISKVQRQ